MSEGRAKVVSLKGDRIDYGTGANQTVVELLREALEQAERGELVAVGLIKVDPSEFVSVNSAGTKRHCLTAGTLYLQYELAK